MNMNNFSFKVKVADIIPQLIREGPSPEYPLFKKTLMSISSLFYMSFFYPPVQEMNI